MLQPKECITQWFVETQLQLRLFRQYWVKQRLLDPDRFPENLRPDEWRKQFKAWRDEHTAKLAAKLVRELRHVQQESMT